MKVKKPTILLKMVKHLYSQQEYKSPKYKKKSIKTQKNVENVKQRPYLIDTTTST